MNPRPAMKIISVALLIAAICVTALAQSRMAAWQFLIPVTPGEGNPMKELVVPLKVLGQAREDLADLRIVDAKGSEIPYALLIRREVDRTQEIAASVFNQASSGKAGEMSVDLGENSGEHNEVEVVTGGMDFRRQVSVEGSDDGKTWKTLTTGAVIFSMTTQNQTLSSDRVTYPTSRYRFLRVRVFADELTDRHAPTISQVKVTMAVREQGELTQWGLSIPQHEYLRNQGAPASGWTIDLGGRVPCDRLLIDFAEDSFSRLYTLEVIDDLQNIRVASSGELSRRLGEKRQPLIVPFEEELYVRKLRLVVNDYSNPGLSISAITAAAPARQLVFELKDGSAQPLQLYFGNPKATAPHYDFEKELWARQAFVPVRATTKGSVGSNPDFRPEPLPLTERAPWLIYLVLSLSSIALALILISLARTSLKTNSQIS
jgi:hypothetical protein